MQPRHVITSFGLVVLASCGFPKTGAAPGPVAPGAASAAEQRWPGTTAAHLDEGRNLFIAKCNGCHGYPDLRAIPEERWEGVMKKMGDKADLSAEQSSRVLRFILVARQ